MSEHASAIEAAMKAGGFDPLNHVARKSVEDAVAAYLSERSGEVVVKPLEWSDYPSDGRRLFEGQNQKREYLERATHPFGTYFLMYREGGHYSLESDKADKSEYQTAAEARAAAQADYSARILSAIAAPPAEGYVTVPVEPPEALLKSMAIRYDHGLGVPGYYDQPIFGAENVGHARRLESTMTTMRQLYEEVVGKGFYRASKGGGNG